MSGCGKSSRLLSAFPPACGSHAGLRGHIVCCAHAWRLKYNPAGSCMGLAALVLLRDWADRGCATVGDAIMLLLGLRGASLLWSQLASPCPASALPPFSAAVLLPLPPLLFLRASRI